MDEDLASKDIFETLEKPSNLKLDNFNTINSDPLYNILCCKMDQMKYENLISNVLSNFNKNDLPPAKYKKKNDTNALKDAYKSFFYTFLGFFEFTNDKNICSSLNTLEEYLHIKNDVNFDFEDKEWEEEIQSDNLQSLKKEQILSEQNFEEFYSQSDSKIKSLDETINTIEEYRVEEAGNYLKIEEHSLNPSLVTQGIMDQGIIVSDLITRSVESISSQIRQEWKNSEKFDYWAFLEPEKWKIKQKKIKSSLR